MTDTDAAPDWRDPAAYEYVKRQSPDQRRWEFLRRSREYRDAFAKGLADDPQLALARFGVAGYVPDPSARGDELPPAFRFARYGEIHGRHPAFWSAAPTRARLGASPQRAALKAKALRARRVAEQSVSVSDGAWAYSLELSVEEQVEAFREHLLRLRAAVAAMPAAQPPQRDSLERAPAQPFAAMVAGSSGITESESKRMWRDGAEATDLEPSITAEDYRRGWNTLSRLERHPAEEDELGALALAPDRKPKQGQASAKLLRVLDALDAGALQAEIACALFDRHRPNTSTAIKDARAAARAAAKSWP